VAAPRKPTAFLQDPRQVLERAEREFEQGHVKEAIEMLEHVLTMGTDSAPIRTILGIACARTRQVERAFEHLERAVALEPEAFGPRCALGELYMRLGVPEQGREHLGRALEVATNAQERAYIQALQREERARDRRRVYRPSFRGTPWFLRPWWRRT
jgi:Flp pilus assembly protein TadD